MSIFWLQQTMADVPTGDAWLCASEALFLSGIKFAKRRNDWRLGRWTAKCAIAAYLGQSTATFALGSIEIRPTASGVPEPIAAGQRLPVGVSLSHSNGTAMAAVIRSGVAVGCDLEFIEPRTDGFLADYFTSEEQLFVRQALASDRPALVTLLWSAKESALKALGQGLRLDTRSICVNLGDRREVSGNVAEAFRMFCTQRTQQPACEYSQTGWHPLEVSYSNGDQRFYGWWQATRNFVRTLVADAQLLPPVPLNPPL